MRSVATLLAILMTFSAGFATATTGPDFTVTDVRVSTATDGTITVEIDVENVGDTAGTGFVTAWVEATIAGVTRQNTIDREHFTLPAGGSTTAVFTWIPIGAGDGTIIAESYADGDTDTSNDRAAGVPFESRVDGQGSGLFLR